jgi:hypothetical protein
MQDSSITPELLIELNAILAASSTENLSTSEPESILKFDELPSEFAQDIIDSPCISSDDFLDDDDIPAAEITYPPRTLEDDNESARLATLAIRNEYLENARHTHHKAPLPQGFELSG